jgi:N-acetylglutamate synthase-like GNAT family acetyltransferase
VASGSLLEQPLCAPDFLVARVRGRLVGCVALRAWSPTVVELGSLVSEHPGMGRQLVDAALCWARARGAERVMALTGVCGFFERVGFERFGSGAPPHRQDAPLLAPKRVRCQACPHRHGCDQVLLQRVLA